MAGEDRKHERRAEHDRTGRPELASVKGQRLSQHAARR
jgi:hypothetical protein